MALIEKEPVKKTPIELSEETKKLVEDIDVNNIILEEDEPEEEPEDEETEEENAETEDDASEEEGTDVAEDSGEEDDTDTKGKRVPLVKYVEEKKKRQQLESETLALKLQLQELQGDTAEREATEYQQKIKDKYVKLGYDEELATTLAEDMSTLYKATRKTAQASTLDQIDKYSVAISKLKTESEYYDNAESFTDKIRETMKSAEKAGLTITAKQAYNMVVDPDVRQKELTQRKRATGTKEPQAGSKAPVSNGSKSNTANVLTSKVDREALKYLQENFPSMEWTVKKYTEWKKNKQ